MTANFAEPNRSEISDRGLVFAVYVLYALGFFTAITALVGVIMAHVKIANATPVAATHFQFQIRTFWIGLLYLVIGGVTAFFIVGFVILGWWFLWTIIRLVKGLILLNENMPVSSPQSWLFG